MSGSDLKRFHTAQADEAHGYLGALAEIRSAGKQSHWIWYVFPQLAGLGQSLQARRFGLAGRAEAEAYLEDPLLMSRLLEISAAVSERLAHGFALLELMGSTIDVQKLVSSLTLFEQIARERHVAHPSAEHEELVKVATRVLAAAEGQGYPRCAFTQRALGQ